jgi:hypothetical protein
MNMMRTEAMTMHSAMTVSFRTIPMKSLCEPPRPLLLPMLHRLRDADKHQVCQGSRVVLRPKEPAMKAQSPLPSLHGHMPPIALVL